MANRFGIPIIFLSSNPTPTPGDDVVIGGGTGQQGSHATPMSYALWLDSDYAKDIIIDGSINEDDYAAWWESCGFDRETWEEMNPDLPWDDYFG